MIQENYPDLYTYVLIPLLIFGARILDVSIGTVRIIFVSRGYKIIAPVLGFFEILIWVIAISGIMKNLDNFLYYIVYAAGFASGTYIGMILEEKLAIGNVLVRIFTSENINTLLKELHDRKFGTTSLDAKGQYENVQVIYTVLKRERMKELSEIINRSNPKAFYVVEDVRQVRHGVFPMNPPKRRRRKLRKSK